MLVVLIILNNNKYHVVLFTNLTLEASIVHIGNYNWLVFPGEDSLCHADATAEVSDICDNKQSCKLDLKNKGFAMADSQCPYVKRKYLEVKYGCNKK